jgi:hypothetical protein
MTRETVNDPWAALAVALLVRAKQDAARGDVGALAWLVYAGRDMADALSDGAGHGVLAFARDALTAMDAGAIRAAWRV